VGAIFFLVSPAVAMSLFAEGSHGEDIQGHVKRSILFIAIILTPAIAITVLLSSQILLLFGHQYAENGATLLVLLAFAAIPDAITNIAVSVLRVRQQLHLAVILNLSMATIAIGLSWVLLPHFGILAPGIAWITAQTAGSVAVGVEMLRDRRTGSRHELTT
jgi:O-antigen/teichoic acid export membrane protein